MLMRRWCNFARSVMLTALDVADFGRRRFDPAVIASRRHIVAVVCRLWWYPVIREFHRLFIPIGRAVV